MPRIICAEIAMRPMRSPKIAAIGASSTGGRSTASPGSSRRNPLPQFPSGNSRSTCRKASRLPLPPWRQGGGARRSHQHQLRTELSRAHTPSLLARRGANFRDGVARELVGALVHQVAGMASNPVPAHVVALERGVEPLPQVDILDRLLVGCAPAVALPIADP